MKKIILALGFMGIFAGSPMVSFAGYFNTTPINRCDTSINSQLQVGSENSDVYTLQQFLNRAGYLNVSPNGYFGPSTRLAVKSFQEDNYIPSTGIVGPSTLNALNERMCDTDVFANYSSSYDYTYVNAYDPYVTVVTPPVSTPVVYTNPQNGYTVNNQYYNNQTTSIFNPSQSQVQSTNIIYSPSIGYTYGVVPRSGSLTVSAPVANSVYNEGDTVYVSWTTQNINSNSNVYNIVLENTSSGQKKIVTYTTGNSASFILTKDILDAVCSGTCDNANQGSFRISITTPVTDISGTTFTFTAGVSPITIKRPYTYNAQVSVSASKTPVNSNEVFKLYVNVPVINTSVYGNYSVKIHAICTPSVQVSIAGIACGQDFDMPMTQVNLQREVPVVITNGTYYRQDVTFVVTATNVLGQVIGTAQTTVTANATAFNW